MRKPKVISIVRLVKQPLAKNCCQEMVNGSICGSFYTETVYVSGRISVRKCYPNGHLHSDCKTILKKAS